MRGARGEKRGRELRKADREGRKEGAAIGVGVGVGVGGAERREVAVAGRGSIPDWKHNL